MLYILLDALIDSILALVAVLCGRDDTRFSVA